MAFDLTYVTIVCITNQDEYSRLSRNASLGVHGYILVFSIVSRQSFEMVNQINDLLLNTLGDAPDVPRVLVGCMKDLTGQRQVNQAVRSCGIIIFSVEFTHATMVGTKFCFHSSHFCCSLHS
jgi:GTPase SAR1 family protein